MHTATETASNLINITDMSDAEFDALFGAEEEEKTTAEVLAEARAARHAYHEHNDAVYYCSRY